MQQIMSIVMLLTIMLPSQASNVTQINRYSTVTNKPLTAQISPLKAVQQMHFPVSIHTIEEAVRYWLRYSGYHLASKENQSDSLRHIFQQPLPQISRNLGPLTIEDGLTVLVGQHLFELKKDDLLREINFSLIKRRAS